MQRFFSKKIYFLIMMMIVFVNISSLYAAAKGDVDANSIIDAVDALLTAQYSVDLNPPSFDPEAADVEGCDGSINILDALLIAQYTVDLIEQFPCSQTTPPPPRNDIGMNVGSIVYWNNNSSYNFYFANQILQSKIAVGNFNTLGFPTGSTASIYLWADSTCMNGTYQFSCNGQVSVSVSGGTISNLKYTNGVTTATFVYPNASRNTVSMTFSNMTPNADGSITNVKLMRPVTQGSTTSYSPSTTFIDEYIRILQKFSVLRTMDFTATNANNQVNWSDRTTKNHFSQCIEDDNYGWQGRGAAWEYVIELANTVNRDIWICVPAKATDDYVTQLATLFKNTLNPNLKLYVEYSNELWNTAGAFSQSLYNYDQAQNDPALKWDGTTNDWYLAWRRIGKRGAEISQIFRNVFGDSQMMTRVRPVLASQLSYTNGPLLQAINYLQSFQATQANDPHPLSYYFWGGGGTGYYGGDGSSVDEVLNGLPGADFAGYIQDDVDFLTPFGLKRIAYEAGPGFDALSAAQKSAWEDPRMTGKVVDAHHIFTRNGGDVCVYFALDGDERWRWPGITNETYFSSPKIFGIDQLNTLPVSPCTYGTVIPSQISAGSYSCPTSWLDGNGNPSNAQLNSWWGYTLNSPSARAYFISVSAGAVNNTGRLKLSVDGIEVGSFIIPNTGSTSNYVSSNAFTVNMNTGKHGILIQCTGGAGFRINKIIIE